MLERRNFLMGLVALIPFSGLFKKKQTTIDKVDVPRKPSEFLYCFNGYKGTFNLVPLKNVLSPSYGDDPTAEGKGNNYPIGTKYEHIAINMMYVVYAHFYANKVVIATDYASYFIFDKESIQELAKACGKKYEEARQADAKPTFYVADDSPWPQHLDASDLNGQIPIEYFYPNGKYASTQGGLIDPTQPIWGRQGEWTLYKT